MREALKHAERERGTTDAPARKAHRTGSPLVDARMHRAQAFPRLRGRLAVKRRLAVQGAKLPFQDLAPRERRAGELAVHGLLIISARVDHLRASDTRARVRVVRDS